MNTPSLEKYSPKASRKTQVLLEQLFRGGTRSQRPDSIVLEEVMASLRTDQFVLQTLSDTLERIHVDDGVSQELVAKSAARCAQLALECEVIGANTALSCGATERAARILKSVSGLNAESIPEALRPVFFRLFVSVAWASKDAESIETFVRTAQTMDTESRFTGYLDGMSRLLQARVELQSGRPDSAIRICQTLDRETKAGNPLKVLTLELQADAFRQMEDAERELKVLEDWEHLLRGMPNGPCDLAVAAETTGASPSISGRARSEEILIHYSRLARIYEVSPETRTYARGIYHKFLNTAYHRWVDSEAMEFGTIEQRLARQSVPKPNQPSSDDAPPSNAGITIIEPARSYGRIADAAIDAMLKELSASPASAYCAVVVSPVNVKERQFRILSTGDSPINQMLQEMLAILNDHDTRSFGTFQCQLTSVVWKAQPMEWVVVTHSEDAPEIRALSFGLRVDKVGDHMDLAVYALYTYQPPLAPDAREELAAILRKKPADLGGYGALEGLALDLIKKAAHRLDLKAIQAGGPHKRKGPVPI